ncbi:hypothetical protein [Thalassotalea euphylliae]|uniref:Uncharacterized protein n=1 Tax=Thalassotalea euphylliae TaxID=1655234 RepID=A0A3E0U4V5_9GAMM|nr:hypothetical protein [Thalassotalea euphylliae]REL31607.1 hypothetical protein DXX94_13255 [Thalassotalea euphylliae]
MTINVKSAAQISLVLAATIAFVTAIAHLSCIWLGEACYSAQMAPEVIIESAQQGTWLAPIGTVLAASIFVIIGLYNLSAAQILRPLPLYIFANYFIAAMCIIRGILPLQLWLRKPERVSEEALIAGLMWLATGVLILSGHCEMRRQQRKAR